LESHKMMVKEEFKGVVGINVLYFIVWYAFLIRQTTTRRYLAHKQKKEDDKKKFDRYYNTHPRMLNADRTVQNTIEQAIPFLTSLWMYAIFVNPKHASYLGFVYILFRSIYPFVWGRVPWLFISTVPGYAIIWYMMTHTVK